MEKSAKSPLETAAVFIPKTRQVIVPDPVAHESDFPAAVAADPADAVIEVTLAAGKLRVHWNPAGCAPPVDVNETETPTVAPGVPEVEPTPNTTL
jgi:hypothetical protein